MLILLTRVLSAAEESWVVSSRGMGVPFRSWAAEGTGAGAEVLVLVPGYNGDGARMLDERWKAFAQKNGLALLAPTFRAAGHENNRGKGYYYPEQGSGEVMEKALKELKRRTGADTDKVLFFGFSAGAHYAHRFALWKPQRVRAFVAYSAAWWSEPTARLKKIPALVMCGEADERYAATYEFFRKGHKLDCPWIWRSYERTGHSLTPAVRDMAEAFLAWHATRRGDSPPLYGDIQTFKTVVAADRDKIPEELRVELPSQAVADVWEKE